MNTDASQTLTVPRYIMAPFYKSENLFRNIYGKDMDKITLGGGTVLAMHWQHRVSTDLDYFLNPQNLTGKENISLISNAADYLENAAAKNIIHSLNAAPYHLKFMIDKTEVSLFTSTPLTDDPTTHHEKHTSLRLDNITEILSKKLSGRVMNLGTFAIRDFYDFCVACHKTPESFNTVLNMLNPNQLTEIADEIKDWRNSPLIRQSDKDQPLLEPVYQELADNVWRISEDVIRHNTIPEHLFADIPPTKQLSR